LAMPPRTIEGPLGQYLTLAWGILWVAAIIPAIATFHNRYKIEYPTILLVLAAVAIYAANLWAQVPDTHTRPTQALTVTALAIGGIGFLGFRAPTYQQRKNRSAEEAHTEVEAAAHKSADWAEFSTSIQAHMDYQDKRMQALRAEVNDLEEHRTYDREHIPIL